MTAAIRPATPEDSPRLAVLLRWLLGKMRPYTIYGCAGLDAYLRDTLAEGNEPMMVCTADAHIVGLTAWRLQANSLFLNHIYVRPAYRGRDLGRRLLRDGLRLTHAAHAQMALDVFDHNLRARRWYASLGFRLVGEKVWLRQALPPSAAMPAGCAAEGLPEADRQHQRYGFSRFELTTPRRSYQVGRLGETLFRATTGAILADETALRALAALAPERALLCIAEDPVMGHDALLLGRSLRMAAPLDTVREHLAEPVYDAP